MPASILRLYPLPAGEYPLERLYLAQEMAPAAGSDKPFVYSNFIASLDGRIAVAREGRATHQVPAAIANPRDWRLYQELAGRADILITSGRYFRQSEIDEAQDRLPLSSQPDYRDIHEWRSGRGLAAQPDIAILSRSLEIPLRSLEGYRNRRIIVCTGRHADAGRMARLAENGVEVVVAGADRSVDGAALITKLATIGYANIYAVAGPGVLHTLLEAGALNRLYLTLTHQLLGGVQFDTLTRGGRLDPVLDLRLVSLYLDPHAPAGAGQWFSAFEPRHRDEFSRNAPDRRGPAP
jgi:riboflavin biosynthesis pyrimidine reductase